MGEIAPEEVMLQKFSGMSAGIEVGAWCLRNKKYFPNMTFKFHREPEDIPESGIFINFYKAIKDDPSIGANVAVSHCESYRSYERIIKQGRRGVK
jgi:hypothetical protein